MKKYLGISNDIIKIGFLRIDLKLTWEKIISISLLYFMTNWLYQWLQNMTYLSKILLFETASNCVQTWSPNSNMFTITIWNFALPSCSSSFRFCFLTYWKKSLSLLYWYPKAKSSWLWSQDTRLKFQELYWFSFCTGFLNSTYVDILQSCSKTR